MLALFLIRQLMSKQNFPLFSILHIENGFGSLLVADISSKRAHSATAPPVSRALSSLQWFVGYLIDKYR
jgi:hypothetical protein